MPTAATSPYPDVPVPAGADKVYDWDDPSTSEAYRFFQGRVRTITADDTKNRPWSEDITVCVEGTQDPDGTINRDINVHQLHHDDPITANQARQLAAALLEAAAELDRWVTR